MNTADHIAASYMVIRIEPGANKNWLAVLNLARVGVLVRVLVWGVGVGF